MRVFDSYYFNIIDKVSFGKTLPYLEKMLSETGLSYKNTAFDLNDIYDGPQKKALSIFPAMEKYAFFNNEQGNGYWGLRSYSANWRDGEIYVDKADEGDVYALFSKVPHTFGFSTGDLILDGVNWFSDSNDALGVDWSYRLDFPVTATLPFYSNRVVQYRTYGDGRKMNRVSVCIEVTDKDRPQNSRAVIEKLIPYLGEYTGFSRKCIFSIEETGRFKAFEKEERTRLRELAKKSLPEPRQHKPWANPNVVPKPDPKLNHVADKFTLDKAFKGTVFTRQKGQPNWLSLYSFTDEHGFLYEAYVQKLTYCITNDFRVWMAVSGCNFSLTSGDIDYYVTEEGESLEILKQFAEFCVKFSEEYGGELAEKFGETPAWYYDKSI